MEIRKFQKKGKEILIQTNQGNLFLQGIKENIIRCVFHKKTEMNQESPLDIEAHAEADIDVRNHLKEIEICTERLKVSIEKDTGKFRWIDRKTGCLLLAEKEKELQEKVFEEYGILGDQPDIERIYTVDGERNMVKNLRPLKKQEGYSGKLHFQFKKTERIHGLGQGEEGIFNYRGNTQYLYQHNMRIPVPFFISDQGYGVLVDCGSLMIWNDDARGSYLMLDAIEQLDYYLISGKNLDEIIDGYRFLTGKAAMLPKWAFGYLQSKESYHNQEELVQTVAEYRKRNIPLDGIIQDWNTWEKDAWGEKILDKKRYPDFAEAVKQIHEMHAKVMISIWPNMNLGTKNNQEFLEKKQLLYDFSTYNAFSEEARRTYWSQVKRELYSAGIDGWWCDSTEPYSAPDWDGGCLREPWERYQLVGEEHKKYLGAERANLFAVAHAKGVFENQRLEKEERRVVNLTRSGYAGSQKYGTVLWSGDICATWDTLEKQIKEGLNMCMSGIPYWTLDIGGFFVVKENWEKRGCNRQNDPLPKWFWQGGYEEGVSDAGYRELYVRWLQYGTFLPVFRSHGTDTPREIWNFGEKGEIFYDAIAKSIELRYRLLPYIYSMAGKVYSRNQTMMRSLLFDFYEDEKARDIETEFMFGESILVCPITKPMYYEKEGKRINRCKSWSCYLPGGSEWYEFDGNERYPGGTMVNVDSGIDKIPLFVRAGSVLPMEKKMMYTGQKIFTPLQLYIYPGKDAVYEYYEDEGDGYGYEKGIYNIITMEWKDFEHSLTIGTAEYTFAQGIIGRSIEIILGEQRKQITYRGEKVTVTLSEV